MARPPRIEFPGAFYHIIVRGNQKQDIFIDKQDRTEFLERIKHYKEKYGFVLYAYVLMTNHVHLLIETPKTPISKIMQLINFTYTQYFNKKYGKVGHLFQGRYKSFLCDRDEYLLGLVRYIHLNPVRAGIASSPEAYQWSSHRNYLTKDKGIADPDDVLRLFSVRVSDARKLYGNFVSEAIGTGTDASFYNAAEQQVIGGDLFLEKVEGKIDKLDKPIRKASLQQIIKAVEEVSGITWDEIISRSRKEEIIFSRGLLIAAWRETGHRMTDLQPMLNRDLSVLSRLSKITENQKGQDAMNKILKKLNARMQA